MYVYNIVCVSFGTLWSIHILWLRAQLHIISLQPDINQFSSQLLPSLLDYLAHVTSGDAIRGQGKANVSLTRTFYALEKFCESLGKGF